MDFRGPPEQGVTGRRPFQPQPTGTGGPGRNQRFGVRAWRPRRVRPVAETVLGWRRALRQVQCTKVMEYCAREAGPQRRTVGRVVWSPGWISCVMGFIWGVNGFNP